MKARIGPAHGRIGGGGVQEGLEVLPTHLVLADDVGHLVQLLAVQGLVGVHEGLETVCLMAEKCWLLS